MEFPLHGDELLSWIEEGPDEEVPIAEDFLYEGAVLMLSAEPGCGKSIIAGQLALCIASGSTLFGFLGVPRPRNVYYMQLEGTERESRKRLYYMQQAIPVSRTHFFWDIPPLIDATNLESVEATVRRIQHACPAGPDVVIIDPIYMAVAGDLKEGAVAASLIRFYRRLQQAFGCAVILVHHTHRTSRARDTGQLIAEDDPFYGSQWLKANVDVAYHLSTANEQRTQVRLKNTKSRGADVKKNMLLNYNPETYTCEVSVSDSLTAEERVIHHLRGVYLNGGHTDFYVTSDTARVPHATLRRVQRGLVDRGLIRVESNGNARSRWIVTDRIQTPSVPENPVNIAS